MIEFNKAIHEIEQAKNSHPSHLGFILIFNGNEEFRIRTNKQDFIKIIDFHITLFNKTTSTDKREILDLNL